MDERELVRKILQGDQQAKAEFYVAHRERLYKDCVYLLGYQDHEAEDIVQEAFITAFRKLHEFKFQSSLGTWLTQIGIYLCYNRYRRRAKTLAQEHSTLESFLNQASLKGGEDRDGKEERKAKLRLIDKCLGRLGKECGDVIRLRDLEGRAYVEIGRMLKIPLGTVMSRLSRCKKALKTLIQQVLKEGPIG